MKIVLGLALLIGIIGGSSLEVAVTASEKPLFLAYPPNNHQTNATEIFLIGTASPDEDVFVNGQLIQRSKSGNFAPTFPLQIGENLFILHSKKEKIKIKIVRISNKPEVPKGIAFAQDSLTPQKNIARLPNELICFGAIAPPNATVTVKIGLRSLSLLPQLQNVQLPLNSVVLTESSQTSKNQPISSILIGQYQGCTTFSEVGNLGHPLFQLNLNGQSITQASPGTIEILSQNQLEVIEVIANEGVTRTGPNSDYSRLTPLSKGTIASVTGKDGEWLRLDYGAWIQQKETRLLSNQIYPVSMIRGINSRQNEEATEIIFPLQIPVPISVQQGDKTFVLTLYNTTAQTDTIHLDDNPFIKRLDWQQITPTQVQYTFHLKSEQQWGYNLRYEGTSLILSLRHAAKLDTKNRRSLRNIKILLDPGHGGNETGTKGPTGYPEKDINLVVSKLLQQELIQRGATVYMTRESDQEVSLQERVEQINKLKPTLAISIHYNALPDGGDAMNTKGVGSFWYHPQAHSLAVFLHNYLVEKLNRPSYGVFWNNLALTRPYTTPSVLLELGFLIHPEEFEWITNPEEQEKLAKVLADGITEWFHQ